MTTPKHERISSLRALPSVDEVLRTEGVRDLARSVGLNAVTGMVRRVCDEMRTELACSSADGVAPSDAVLERVVSRVLKLGAEQANGICRVINATGVILHTNLGRAPLAESVREAMIEAAGYCTVEFDLWDGERGPRGRRAEEMLAELTGAESAVVVNNGAAAALLVLTALSNGGAVVLSRGELVEIGGDFRIPDVMARSGAQLDEVGTTNRTKLSDYEQAIDPATTMLMRVHPSNYRLVGFTTAPELKELAALAHARGLILYEDAGSGALIDMTQFGMTGEPIIGESVAAGADVVSFSGDKLLGGVQAGLIVGRRELLDRIRRHPLYRALRPDKTTLAAVEATLAIYRKGTAATEIPALRMIAAGVEAITLRARSLADRLKEICDTQRLAIELIDGESAIGGGAAPTTHPPTTLIALRHETLSPDQLAATLRRFDPPVIARIVNDRVVLDLRTVEIEEEAELLAAVVAAAR